MQFFCLQLLMLLFAAVVCSCLRWLLRLMVRGLHCASKAPRGNGDLCLRCLLSLSKPQRPK